VEQLHVQEQAELELESEHGSGVDNPPEPLEQPIATEVVPDIPIQQQILEAKEELARVASLINEDPEDHVGGFRTLAHITASSNPTIQKLGLATQLAVFKDVIPGYRIRPIGEGDMGEKLSKDVRRLRGFEQALVSSYQAYIKELTKYAKIGNGGGSAETSSLSHVAISCACALLLAVPHFNFRGDLLRIVVNKLSTKNVDATFIKCRETIESLFRDDEDGTAALDAVTLLTRMMKARNYQVDESVLNTLLHLRLLSEFSSKASQNQVDKPAEGKPAKVKKEFRTKKQRKLLKERKAVEKEFKEADAIVSHEERDRKQAEMLKLVFIAYFRILKARSPKLMGAVLEGLAKYAHLINQDFFGDLLEALKDLIRHPTGDSLDDEPHSDEAQEENDEEPAEGTGTTSDMSPTADATTRSSLLCIVTAFALLEGQDTSRAASSPTLNLDLTFFTNHLYQSLYALCLSPAFSPIPSAPPAPTTRSPPGVPPSVSKVNLLTAPTLLLRALAAILSPRTTPPVRLAAFTKQLTTCALHLPEKPATALLALLARLGRTHGRRVARLWDTEARKSDGAFDPLRADPEGSNPLASTVWEGELLKRHYSPKVREGYAAVEAVVKAGAAR
jgi:nucleolar complex protein 3